MSDIAATIVLLIILAGGFFAYYYLIEEKEDPDDPDDPDDDDDEECSDENSDPKAATYSYDEDTQTCIPTSCIESDKYEVVDGVCTFKVPDVVYTYEKNPGKELNNRDFVEGDNTPIVSEFKDAVEHQCDLLGDDCTGYYWINIRDKSRQGYLTDSNDIVNRDRGDRQRYDEQKNSDGTYTNLTLDEGKKFDIGSASATQTILSNPNNEYEPMVTHCSNLCNLDDECYGFNLIVNAANDPLHECRFKKQGSTDTFTSNDHSIFYNKVIT